MTEEKGNTIDLRFDYYLDDNDLEEIRENANRLANSHPRGLVKVIIEFYPDNEDSEVEDE